MGATSLGQKFFERSLIISRVESVLQKVHGAKGKLGQRESSHFRKGHERKLSYCSTKGRIIRFKVLRFSRSQYLHYLCCLEPLSATTDSLHSQTVPRTLLYFSFKDWHKSFHFHSRREI